MTSLAAAAVVTLILTGTPIGAPPPPDRPSTTARSGPTAEADPALLEEILQGEEISTEIPVSRGEYLESIWQRLVAGMTGVLGRHAGWLGPASILLLWVLAGAVVMAMAWLSWRVVTVVLDRRSHKTPEAEVTLDESASATQQDISLLYQRALAAREYRTALSLLWLRVAGGLSEAGLGHLEHHLTQREFIASVRDRSPRWPRLPALVDLGRHIEAAVYGPLPPTGEQVRQVEKMAGELLG